MRFAPGTRRGAAILVAVVAGLALPAAAAAATPSFAVQVTGSRDPYFVMGARPGTTASGNVTVINVGSSAGAVSLYPTDATTGQTTGAVYESRGHPLGDVGAWIQLASSRLELGPGETRSVPFRVVVPAGVRGGQHLGGIVAQPVQPVKQISGRRGKATFHVQVRSQAVIAVEVNLPGPKTSQLQVTGVRAGAEPGYQTILVGLASTGTVLTKGSGQLVVTDGDGRLRLQDSFDIDTFVPQTSIDYPVQVAGKALPAGNYRATVKLAYAGKEVTRVLPFSITDKNLAQTFGSKRTAAPAAGDDNLVLLIIGGSVLLLAGFALGARARYGGPSRRARRATRA